MSVRDSLPYSLRPWIKMGVLSKGKVNGVTADSSVYSGLL